MEYFPAPLEKLVEQFAGLPGIGGKSAQRLAFHVLSLSAEEAKEFADAILEAQEKAIFGCHRSQFPEGSPEGSAIRLYLKLRSIDFGLRSFQGRAEGFRVLGVTHMHCLPEAGN